MHLVVLRSWRKQGLDSLVCVRSTMKLNRILENTNLEEFEISVIGSPLQQLYMTCESCTVESGVLWNCTQESTLPMVYSAFPPPNINNACLY